MQLRYEQLGRHLANKPLASIYFVSGDVLLLVQTACSVIRQQATKQGFFEREVFYAESGFDWQAFLTRSNNYGLFAERQMMELHLSQGVSEAAAHMLKTYASDPPANKLLLVTTGKLDRRAQQTAWFRGIDAVGVCVAIWPMEKHQLLAWVIERLKTVGLTAEKEAIQCLIVATEGNLLATAQEIEKLNLSTRLANESGTRPVITLAVMMQVLSDNARFSPFELTDAALRGEVAHCLRILHRLREEGVEPLFLLRSLSRECRQLASFAFQLSQGQDLQMLFKTHSIWGNRQGLLQHALQRHSLAQWHKLLRLAAHADRLIKGVVSGNIWHTLQEFSIQLAGPQTS